jgi:hypothetical protein
MNRKRDSSIGTESDVAGFPNGGYGSVGELEAFAIDRARAPLST